MDERDCLWALDFEAVNTQLPDTNANYWVAVLPIPPGGSVEFAGDYPHGRYVSYNLYNQFLQPIDALADFEIAADAGAINPFLLGAQRNGDQRGYTVNLVSGTIPTPRGPNTLYSYQGVGPAQAPTNLAVMLYRNYVPDQGLDLTGGTGLPRITFVNADGSRVSGLAACEQGAAATALLPNLNTLPDPVADLPNLLAFEHLLWLKFYDLPAAQASRVYNSPAGPLAYQLVGSPTSGNGGYLSNRDNRYIYASMSKDLGDLVAIHATFPKTPITSDGRSPMGGGDMRYWSLCTNDGNTTAVFDCLYDEELVRDAQGRGVVVVSQPGDRPVNATVACGVTWLHWGLQNTSLLLMRHMLPLAEAEFPHAIQYISGPPGQNEAKVMAEYYPYGSHLKKSDFEALGCPVSGDQLPSVVTPPPTMQNP